MIDKWAYPLWYKLTYKIISILLIRNIKAWQLTLIGAISAIICAYFIYIQYSYIALLFLLISRICDGLDGPLARRGNNYHPFGVLIDNVGDFIFYGATVAAFSLTSDLNLLPGVCLLFTFYITGGSFLALAAIISEQKNRQDIPIVKKGIMYNYGLMEGTETILFFIAFLLFPGNFPILAWIFSILCLITVIIRIWQVKNWSF